MSHSVHPDILISATMLFAVDSGMRVDVMSGFWSECVVLKVAVIFANHMVWFSMFCTMLLRRYVSCGFVFLISTYFISTGMTVPFSMMKSIMSGSCCFMVTPGGDGSPKSIIFFNPVKL